MKMIKTIILMILMVLCSFVAIAAQTTTQPSKVADISVSLVNQDPDPAEPGKYVDVRFKFDNVGTKQASNVEVELLPQYPFSLYNNDALRSIGTLQSRQKDEVGVIVKYRLRVDENAIEGENELKLRYRTDGGTWVNPGEFDIDIRTHDAILSINSVEVEEKTLKPGSKSKVTIKLANEADSLIKDVKVKMDLSSVPFIPIGSTDEKSIYQIKAKKTQDVVFELLADPEADSGVYKVGINITYYDEPGTEYSKNSIIGLIIVEEPKLSITLDSSDIYQSGKSGEVVVKIVNKGVTDIKFMNIQLASGSGYKILSNNEDYLGNIDSDDYETADFKIFVDKTGNKQITLPITLEYKDAINTAFTEKKDLILDLYTASEAKKFGLIKGNGKSGIFIVILIVVAGLFFYRKWKKSRGK